MRQAIADELHYVNNVVWEAIEIDKAKKAPDHKLIRTRWVMCSKGDDAHPDVRARRAACEVNNRKNDAFVASTPPLEALRLVFSQYATERTRDGQPLQMSFVDVRKAYFLGVPARTLNVQYPNELGAGPGRVGRPVRCMHGTRDAGAIWKGWYTQALASMGIVQGKASPCCVYHPAWQVQVVVHGDDLTALGTDESLQKYDDGMKSQTREQA